jgi:NAD(P)-dependent dehydrogenase (short-subunit alcohol dehydrogenase family)
VGRLSGKVAVVTGAASGIGRESAIRFAIEGATVVGGDLNVEGGEETVEMCRREGGEAAFVKTDVAIEAEVENLIGQAVERFGGLNIVFNNAGATGAIGPIETTPVEDWDWTQNVGLRSVFLGIKHAVAPMRRGGGGSIISTASMAGERGVPGLHAYCAAKAGVINLTRSTAIELAEYGIRVNCICPGDILTPMRASGLSQPEMERQLSGLQPIGRAGQARDVAGAAVYLASDDAEWVTGVALNVDGGALTGVWAYGKSSHHDHVRKQGFLGPSFLRSKPPAAAET